MDPVALTTGHPHYPTTAQCREVGGGVGTRGEPSSPRMGARTAIGQGRDCSGEGVETSHVLSRTYVGLWGRAQTPT